MNTMEKKVSFQELINSENPVLVDFSAEWCGPCKAMAPILQEVAGMVKNNAKIIKIDVDRNQALSQEMKVMGVPTFILFQKGEVKWRQSGMISAQALTEIIQKHIPETV